MNPRSMQYTKAVDVPVPDSCCNCVYEFVCKYIPDTSEKREEIAILCKYYKRTDP